MRATMRTAWVVLSLGIGIAAVEPSRSEAQMNGMGRSLGGYGAATIGSYTSSRGGPLIPFGGGQGGFIPYEGLEGRRSTATVLMPRPQPQTSIGGAGMGGIPIGGASRMQGPNIYQPLNFRGRFGMGRGPADMPGRYGPGLGYPFRQPPSLRGGMGSM